jgi:hypothetical protein
MKILLITKSELSPGIFLRQSKKSIIHKFLNFTTMKKQFLILVLAFLASTVTVFGQTAVHHSYPLPLFGCADGPLSPIAGKLYNYNVDVNPAGGQFQWWATTNQSFISGGTNNMNTMLLSPTTTPPGTDLVATSASYGTGSPTDNADIAWSSSTLATAETTPTFVVVQYDAVPPGCSNNLKVYKIDPINGFTVDVRNLFGNYDTVAYGVPVDTCVSPVSEAIYNTGNNGIDYNFGDNKLLFEVVLANFTTSAVVSFSISNLVAQQTADLSWGYTPATANTTALGSGLGNGDLVTDANVLTDETNTSVGVSIFVLATIHNNRYEGTADTPFTLAVDAVNAAGNPDVVNADCTIASFEDQATQILLARPTVTSTTTGGNFLIVNP